MLEIEVDDLGQRVHLGSLEVADELCQTFLELGVFIKRSAGIACVTDTNLQTTGSKQFCPSMVRLAWLGNSTGYTTSTPISIMLCTTISYFWS
jgi:hypothetical protein